MRGWLADHWVTGALFMSGALFALAPLFPGGAERVIFLAGPLYMAHQVEEHWGDRFRRFVNTRVFGGVEALTVADVLWINLPGVWGINLAALYAARLLAPGWGLAAIYLIGLNGLAHVAMAVRLRAYNPGLWSGVALFVPFGLLGLAIVPGTLAQHLFALAVALLVHGAILVRVKHNAARGRPVPGGFSG
ncbi:HXXEE domain-containing protein [Xanthobacter sp. V4C-4]|uniref:HXXEE domain-containing protein n=1 Tax=Xanthobacter cornucopiae TaxID=3119924 RepID=UPI0037282B6C